MSIMAYWGPMSFEVSTSRIAVLQNLTTSLTLKEDSENDTSGTEPTNTRGRNLRPIAFDVVYHAAAGNDPRAMISMWESLLGFSFPLVIGGQRFGEGKMKLKNVSTNGIQLTNSGGFIQATVSISLEEYSEGKTSKLLSQDEEDVDELEEETPVPASPVREQIFGNQTTETTPPTKETLTSLIGGYDPFDAVGMTGQTLLDTKASYKAAFGATASKSDKAERKVTGDRGTFGRGGGFGP